MSDERLAMVKNMKLKMLQQCTGLVLSDDVAAAASASEAASSSGSAKRDASLTGVLKLAGDTELLPFSIDRTANSAEQIEAQLWRLVEQSCDQAALSEFEKLFSGEAQ